jgi:IclR family acetate operon transcriptional repressor
MPVKPIQAVQRALTVLEAIAELQPVSLATLYREVGFDKSTTQRLLVTLDHQGWIRTTADDATRWELSLHALVVVRRAEGRTTLVERAHPALVTLHRATGETVVLAVPDQGRIVAIDVLESDQLVRTSPRVGMTLPPDSGGAGLAILAWLPPDEVGRYVEDPEDPELVHQLAETRERGWSLSSGSIRQLATSIGTALRDTAGRPVAALVVTGPSDRLTPELYETTAALMVEVTASLGAVGVAR